MVTIWPVGSSSVMFHELSVRCLQTSRNFNHQNRRMRSTSGLLGSCPMLPSYRSLQYLPTASEIGEVSMFLLLLPAVCLVNPLFPPCQPPF